MSTISLADLCQRWGRTAEHARVTLHRAGVKPVNPGRRGHLRYRLSEIEAVEACGQSRQAELDPWAILDAADAARRLQ